MTPQKNFWHKLVTENSVDFIILFLAITLGFFVDNYRDKLEQKETANEMAGGIVVDISSDTVEIHELLNHARNKMMKMDSLFSIMSEHGGPYHDSLVYQYSACVNHHCLFERNKSTFNLLVSTGYLRYLSKEAAGAITDYDIDFSRLSDLLSQERLLLSTKVYPFQQQIFNTENFHYINLNERPVSKLTLRNWNAESWWLYRNYLTELKLINSGIVENCQHVLEKANGTLNILRNEYKTE